MQAIEHLDALTNLQQLWLGRNRISQIHNLATLTNLRQLSLQANRLESMAGVGACVGLAELYLSQNGIKKMEDLAPLTNLTVLDLAMNQIEVVRLLTMSMLSGLLLGTQRECKPCLSPSNTASLCRCPGCAPVNEPCCGIWHCARLATRAQVATMALGM